MAVSYSLAFFLVLLAGILCGGSARSARRVTRDLHGHDENDPALHLKYARPHPGTQIVHAYAQRFAPRSWPKWHTWTMLRWNAQTRFFNPHARGQGVRGGSQLAGAPAPYSF